MKKLLSFLLLAALLLTAAPLSVAAEEPEPEPSRRTPIMGWASWNACRTDISETLMLAQAQKLIDLGLADLGYVFVNTDDGWAAGRGEDGRVQVNADRFPSGMKSLADSLHEMGLKAGIYTDGGRLTCGSKYDNQVLNDDVGLYEHEEEDLRQYFVEWGFDFIKVDWCGGLALNLSRKTQYEKIGDIVKQIEKETGKDKIFNACSADFPGEWIVDAADSWRMTYDISCDFQSVLDHLDTARTLSQYHGPGHVNDLDMMQVGNGMTYEEDKSHFSMWCMMSTPLLIGTDLCSISEQTLSILSNAELIALDQDPACLPATLKSSCGENVDIWVKDLGNVGSGEAAVALLNRSEREQTVTVRFEDLGFSEIDGLRDLWAHRDLSYAGKLRVTLPAHGCAVYKLSGVADAGVSTEDDGSTVTATVSAEQKPVQINLTTIGNYDWAYYGSSYNTASAGAGELRFRSGGDSTAAYNDASSVYRIKFGSSVESGSERYGLKSLGENAYAAVTCPCDALPRNLSVTVGSYSADLRVRVIIGGKTLYDETIPSHKYDKAERMVKVAMQSDIPTTATVLWEVANGGYGNTAAVLLEAAAVSVTVDENELFPPVCTVSDGCLQVKATAASLTDADCVVALKDEAGQLRELRLFPVAARHMSVNTAEFSVENGFRGSVECFLWKEETPLTAARSAPVEAEETPFVGPLTARALLAQGATLVDVRTPEEYAEGHLDGALNIDYLEIGARAESELPDKSAPILLYCSLAKRSAQAAGTLRALGYTAVYNLGSIRNYEALPTVLFGGGSYPVVTTGDKVEVSLTGSAYDDPALLLACGENASFESALPASEFTVPAYTGGYLRLVCYLAVDGVCCMEQETTLIYWSESTVSAFASDMEWISSSCGWGSVRRDKSSDGHALKLGGRTFSKGIGTHANSEIVINVPAGTTRFLAVAGTDNEVSGGQCCVYRIYLDGALVASSAFMPTGDYCVFDIPLPEGTAQITLNAFEGTVGGNINDHADWAVAAFFAE